MDLKKASWVKVTDDVDEVHWKVKIPTRKNGDLVSFLFMK